MNGDNFVSDASVKFATDSRGVATVTLARADKHNAFDDAVIRHLHDIFTTIAGDESVRVMVLAAEGKSFSAGADLHWMRRMVAYSYEENANDARALADMLACLDRLPQPTVARVQGAAFGGAVGLISCCDVAIAVDAARFCLSEVRLGIIPAAISPYVIAAIGQRPARRYFQTAEAFSAREARQLGLVSDIVAADALDGAIAACVERLLANGPQAMRQAKILVREVANRAITESLLQHTSERIASIRVSPEGQEGLSAFLQKRKPDWTE